MRIFIPNPYPLSGLIRSLNTIQMSVAFHQEGWITIADNFFVLIALLPFSTNDTVVKGDIENS